MDFEVGPFAARLASPAIATLHLRAETVVLVGIEPPACMCLSDLIHDAFSVTRCRKRLPLFAGKKFEEP